MKKLAMKAVIYLLAFAALFTASALSFSKDGEVAKPAASVSAAPKTLIIDPGHGGLTNTIH